MKKVLEFVKKEAVLCVAVLLAAVSAFFVKPGREYAGYIDFRTLAILFCLMCVMAGLKKLGVFKKIAEGMLKTVNGSRGITLVLVLLCFFFSMIITNDVALITFVPFTFTTLTLAGEDVYKKLAIPVVVLETVAANLGSMLTPIGNPQNLFLYGKAGMGFFDFIALMAPYSVLSLVCIVATAFFVTRGHKGNRSEEHEDLNASSADGSKRLTLTEMFAMSQTKYHSLLIMYILLFLVALLVVLKVLPYEVMFFLTLIIVLFADRKTLLDVDYSLLVTFVGFFVFIGNMGRIPAFSNFLSQIISGREVPVSVASSQIISNVPAALLLSGFTTDFRALIIGTNIGGLGTLIASMASLISFKQIAAKEDISTGKYLMTFTGMNIALLLVLAVMYIILK